MIGGEGGVSLVWINSEKNQFFLNDASPYCSSSMSQCFQLKRRVSTKNSDFKSDFRLLDFVVEGWSGVSAGQDSVKSGEAYTHITTLGKG